MSDKTFKIIVVAALLVIATPIAVPFLLGMGRQAAGVGQGVISNIERAMKAKQAQRCYARRRAVEEGRVPGGYSDACEEIFAAERREKERVLRQKAEAERVRKELGDAYKREVEAREKFDCTSELAFSISRAPPPECDKWLSAEQLMEAQRRRLRRP